MRLCFLTILIQNDSGWICDGTDDGTLLCVVKMTSGGSVWLFKVLFDEKIAAIV